jgi:hypothetical protein
MGVLKVIETLTGIVMIIFATYYGLTDQVDKGCFCLLWAVLMRLA